MQAFTPFVRVATDATRHFATFGLAPAAAFFIPNPARHPFQGWSEGGTPQGIVGLILNHLEIRSETIQKAPPATQTHVVSETHRSMPLGPAAMEEDHVYAEVDAIHEHRVNDAIHDTRTMGKCGSIDLAASTTL